MHFRTRDLKARAEEFEDDYDDAMIEKFLDEVADEMGKDHYAVESSKNWLDGMEASDIDDDFAEEIAAGLTDADQETFMGIVTNFTLEDVNDWCWNKVNNEIADIGDQKYEEQRDREMGI